MTYNVIQIERSQCEEYILGIHYAKRWPSISYAFGLYLNDELCGVVTYGSPPSSTLKRGIAGWWENIVVLCKKRDRRSAKIEIKKEQV